jgi:hypothetical protein
VAIATLLHSQTDTAVSVSGSLRILILVRVKKSSYFATRMQRLPLTTVLYWSFTVNHVIDLKEPLLVQFNVRFCVKLLRDSL